MVVYDGPEKFYNGGFLLNNPLTVPLSPLNRCVLLELSGSCNLIGKHVEQEGIFFLLSVLFVVVGPPPLLLGPFPLTFLVATVLSFFSLLSHSPFTSVTALPDNQTIINALETHGFSSITSRHSLSQLYAMQPTSFPLSGCYQGCFYTKERHSR